MELRFTFRRENDFIKQGGTTETDLIANVAPRSGVPGRKIGDVFSRCCPGLREGNSHLLV